MRATGIAFGGNMAASVKGSAFLSVQGDVLRLIDEGRIDLDEVDSGLTEKDRGLLDMLVTPVSWVPIASYARCLELLARTEGADDPIGYLRNRGREAGRRLLGGAYQGFAKASGGLDLKGVQIFTGIARMIYDFMRWEARALPGGSIEIVISDARAYPDAALHAAEGFLELFGELTSGKRPLVESSRPTRDTVSIRVTASS
jgi:hypothetical protein